MTATSKEITIEVGDHVKINNWQAKVIEIGKDLLLLKLPSGSQFCYGKTAIRESQIIKAATIITPAQLQIF